MSTAPNEQALAVVVAWLDAMRRGDLEAVAGCFHTDVTWRAVRDAARCSNRSEVVDMLADRLATGVPRAAALELIAGEAAVVLGVGSDDLREIAGVPLLGQLYNVFEIRDARIASARDFVRRSDALRAAGAVEPRWA
jgi:ketosteroid isomerase-like protein